MGLSNPTVPTSFSKKASYPDDLYWQTHVFIIIIDRKGNQNGLWSLKLKSYIETTAYIIEAFMNILCHYSMFSSCRCPKVKDGQYGVYAVYWSSLMNLSLTSVVFSSRPTGDIKRKSVGDKPSSVTPNLKPKFLSVRKKPTAGSSTTALIFENRPRYTL